MKRILICLILTALVAGVVVAQDVSVRSDHPDEYTVVQGDTLWDIAGKFLDHPWQWPAIWHANRQIENPHLIYPGDKLSLAYIDGEPRLMLQRGREMVKLSPQARITNRSAITAIPYHEISGFLTNVRLVSPQQYMAAPYVVSNEEGRLNSTKTDFTYARGLGGEAAGQRYAVMRLAHIYYRKDDEIRVGRDPGYGEFIPQRDLYRAGERKPLFKRGEVVGYELYEVAEATLAKSGDPAILYVETGLAAVKEGDLVLPVDSIGYPDTFQPHALDTVPAGLKVLAVQGDNRLVGHQKIVSIHGGSRHGIEPGTVFSAFRLGDTIRDDVKYPKDSWRDFKTLKGDKVTLPAEFGAHIMVFRSFDEISYALVMQGPREVRVDDVLRHPDETL